MKQKCEKIQCLLLDGPEPELTDSDRRHIDSCRSCGQVEKNALEVGRDLDTLGRRAGTNAEILLSSDLHSRVLARLKAGAEPKKREEVIYQLSWTERAWLRFTDLFGYAGAGWRPAGWAAAILAIVFVYVMALEKYADQRGVGQLEFASGAVTVRNLSRREVHEGLPQEKWPLAKGTTLETDPESAGVFSFGEDREILVALDSSSFVEILSKNMVRLDHGSIWLEVKPGGKGFKVQLTGGVVRVTGTSFGVNYQDATMSVEVTKGAVQVGQVNTETVGSGQLLRVRAGMAMSLTARPSGNRLPYWVREIRDQWHAESHKQFIPSVFER